MRGALFGGFPPSLDVLLMARSHIFISFWGTFVSTSYYFPPGFRPNMLPKRRGAVEARPGGDRRRLRPRLSELQPRRRHLKEEEEEEGVSCDLSFPSVPFPPFLPFFLRGGGGLGLKVILGIRFTPYS